MSRPAASAMNRFGGPSSVFSTSAPGAQGQQQQQQLSAQVPPPPPPSSPTRGGTAAANSPGGSENWSFLTYVRIKPPLANETVSGSSDTSALSFSNLKSSLEYHVASNNNSNGQPQSPDSMSAACTLELEVPVTADPGLVHNNASGFIPFQFNRVFDTDVRQEGVFQAVQPMIVDCLKGINCTILAYGQTGSGKTYTISGGETFAERGLVPRSIRLLFDAASRLPPSYTTRIFVSFTEIYGEAVYDLLDLEKRYHPLEEWKKAQVMESEDGLVIKNINVFEVGSVEEALSLFFMGSTNRITSSTPMNKASSRSHAIFTMVVESQTVVEGVSVTRCGKVNFVDLAGSERLFKETNTKDAIREGKSINLSLHYLEQVILSLRELNNNAAAAAPAPTGPKRGASGKKSLAASSPPQHIPYRNSALTSILRDSLGGNCRSCFIFTITTDLKQFEETVSTCRFAQRVGEVRVQVKANSEMDVNDQLRIMTNRNLVLERGIRILEKERDELSAELKKARARLLVLEDRERGDRPLLDSEVATNHTLVLSIMGESAQSTGGVPPPPTATGSPPSAGPSLPRGTSTRSFGSGVAFELSSDSVETGGGSSSQNPNSGTHDDLFPPYSEEAHIKDIIADYDRSALLALCSDMMRALNSLNHEKKIAVQQWSQTSSSASAFVASRFAGRRNMNKKSFLHSSSNVDGMGATPQRDSSASHDGALHPQRTSPSDAKSGSWDDGNSSDANAADGHASGAPGGGYQGGGLPGTMEYGSDSGSTSTMAMAPAMASRSSVPTLNPSSSAAIASAIVGGEFDGNEDVFIDMLIFGDQFLKHGRYGTRNLRHVSVSADLRYLCWSHVNNQKSVKKIDLATMDRVEVGRGNRKLKCRDSCLMSLIPSDTRQPALDFECMAYDTFQENRVFAENWAMGLMYCIAKSKGQI